MTPLAPSEDGGDPAPRRVALISDTHFPRRGSTLPEVVLDALRAADAIVHAGDVCDAPTLAALRELGPPLHAVLGNNDAALAGELPEVLTLPVAGGRRVAVVHDAGPAQGRLNRMRKRFPDHDAVIFGHSHVPLHEQDGGFQIFNPGSPTDRRGRWPVHTFGMLEAGDDGLRFTLLDVER